VTAVLADDRRRACGVLVGGETSFAADVVVANADARHLYVDLLAEWPRSAGLRRVTHRLATSQPSLSGFVMCLAVDGATPDLAHHTVLFPERYDDEFDDLFAGPPRLVRDPTIYISVPRDPAIAPPGCEAWFVLVNAPPHAVDDPLRGVDWRSEGLADSYADRLLELMARRGVDVAARVRWRELRTPADLAERTRAVGGSIYGPSSNGARSAFLRPANRSPVAGLYLVGGSSHPGGGLPLVILSARIVAGLIDDDLAARHR
jgi:phytoene dehydrogenase-like protein